jgi:hypothetical protein
MPNWHDFQRTGPTMQIPAAWRKGSVAAPTILMFIVPDCTVVLQTCSFKPGLPNQDCRNGVVTPGLARHCWDALSATQPIACGSICAYHAIPLVSAARFRYATSRTSRITLPSVPPSSLFASSCPAQDRSDGTLLARIRLKPIHSEPIHSEPIHSEPIHSEPMRSAIRRSINPIAAR